MHLTEHRTEGKPARFYADGVRISADTWENLKGRAYREGTLYGLGANTKTTPEGKLHRISFCSISPNPQR